MTNPFTKQELDALEKRINHPNSIITRAEADATLKENLPGYLPTGYTYRSELREIQNNPIAVAKYLKEQAQTKYKNHLLRDVLELEFPQYLYLYDKLFKK